MRIAYTVSFSACRYFEHDEIEWTDESAMEAFCDLLSEFEDVTAERAEPREGYGKILGYNAAVLIKYRGSVEVSDRFYPDNHDAVALAVLADFMEQANQGLTEIEELGQIAVEFLPPSASEPIHFALSRATLPVTLPV
jgi:hypothetical protein